MERTVTMDNPMEKKSPLNDMMRATMEKIREMVDTNTIVGQPITTPDGVTLIPISKVSFGFGAGGGDYGKTSPKENFGGGSAAGVKIGNLFGSRYEKKAQAVGGFILIGLAVKFLVEGLLENFF